MHKNEKETIEESILFRQPMQIKEVLICAGIGHDIGFNFSYPICPRCDIVLEYDYQAYCENCGQKLKWTYYYRAKPRYPER